MQPPWQPTPVATRLCYGRAVRRAPDVSELSRQTALSLRPGRTRRRRRRHERPRDSRTPTGTGSGQRRGRKCVSDVEHAAGQCQHSGCGVGVGPHPRQREAAHAAEPDEQRAGIVKAATATIVGYWRTPRVEPGLCWRPHPAARRSRGPVGGSCLGGRRQLSMRGNELTGGSVVAYGHSCLVFVSFARSQRTKLRAPLQEHGEVAPRTGPGAAPCGPESSP
jgi:hypothetical protein